MKIQVLNNYGGVFTNEKRILPGIYDASELPAQAVTHMLEAKHAVIIESTAIPQAVEVSQGHFEPLPDTDDNTIERESEPDYPAYTRAELMEMLDNEGIAYGSKDNKDTLIALLTGDDDTL